MGSNPEYIKEVKKFHEEYGEWPSVRMWAKEFGHSKSHVRWAELLAEAKGELAGFQVGETPSADMPIAELLARRKADFVRIKEHEDASKLVPVKIRMDGPIGLAHIGDPHVDDDGTDIARLERDTNIVRETPGMFAGNVGDSTNNWVGRLAALYSEQSTSAAQAWQLCEWLVGQCDWLYFIGGNHDCWSGAGDPLKWITQQTSTRYDARGVRFALQFPNGRSVRVNARHDFAGHSMYNPAHGGMKAALMGWRDHILTWGHRHKSGYGVIKCPATGMLNHAIAVPSYKIYDRYAKEKGLPDQNIAPCAVTVINPDAKDEVGLVQVFFDIEEAADYLTYKRRKMAV